MTSKNDDLKEARKKLLLTQKEFAELLGVSTQTVSKWERNQRKPRETVFKLMQNLVKTKG